MPECCAFGSVQVGNGNLPLGLQRSHFALWALLKSPLLIGTDLTRVSADSLAILKVSAMIGGVISVRGSGV